MLPFQMVSQSHDIKDLDYKKTQYLLAMIDLFSNSHCYDAVTSMPVIVTIGESHCVKNQHFKEIYFCIMESIFEKIPDLGDKIIKELDNQTLVKCKEVQRSWNNFINKEKILWFRMIQNYTGVMNIQ